MAISCVVEYPEDYRHECFYNASTASPRQSGYDSMGYQGRSPWLVSAGEQDRGLAFHSSRVFSADRDPTLLFDANRFDHPYLAISDRPIDLRQVPVSNLPVRFLLNAGGRFLGETLRLAQ